MAFYGGPEQGTTLEARRGPKEAVKVLNIAPLMELADDNTYDCIYGAPTLVIVSGNEQSPIPLDSDCAAATQSLLLTAESIGLGSCWIFFAILAFSDLKARDCGTNLNYQRVTNHILPQPLGIRKMLLAPRPRGSQISLPVSSN